MDESNEPHHVIRSVRQRLESLRRAGLDRLPIPIVVPEAPSAPTPGRFPGRAPSTTPTDDATGRGPLEPSEAGGPEIVPIASRPAAGAPSSPRTAPTEPSRNAVGSLFGGTDRDALGPPVPEHQRVPALKVLAEEVAGCVRCPVLVASRTQTVFGEGSPTARLMFIGEGPGQTEDETGRPFVGRAGQLLTDMITKGMGLRREEVYIANILKCRPPNNRDPLPDEVRNCLGYLERQIAIVRPEFLCLLGRPAAQALLETALPMGRLRGRWHTYRGIPAIATWHPAYVLRKGLSAKREVWDDLKLLMNAMGLTPPPSRRA